MATLPPPPKRERPSAPAPAAPAMAAQPAAHQWTTPQAAAPAQGQNIPAWPARTPSSGGVVVSMPMVIVGGQPESTPAPSPQTQPAAQAFPPSHAPGAPLSDPQFRPTESKQVPDSIFGSDLISEKSLDEVILAYLSEDMMED